MMICRNNRSASRRHLASGFILALLSLLLFKTSESIGDSQGDFSPNHDSASVARGEDASGYHQGNGKRRNRGAKGNWKHPFNTTPRPDNTLLKSGLISDEAARILELSDSERSLAQEVIQRHFKELHAVMAPTVVTTENDNSTSYFIPALKDQGRKEIENFQNELAAILREERAKKALLLLPVTAFFGGFGQFDSYIEVTDRSGFPMDNRPPSDWIQIRYIDPKSGVTMATISTTSDLGFEYFPGMFE